MSTSDNNYYAFVRMALESTEGEEGMDWGMLSNLGPTRLRRILHCRYNDKPWERECGRCLVCQRRKADSKLKALKSSMLSGSAMRYRSVVLSLPKWELGRGNGSRPSDENFGDLFYVTPHLFQWNRSPDFSLRGIISGLRNEAVGALRDCFPGTELGFIVCTHLSNDWLAFSPHFHLLLCEVGFEKARWPLKTDGNGAFVEMRKAWRGLFSGLGQKVFRENLRESWAERLARYTAGNLLEFRDAFDFAKQSENLAFNLMKGMGRGRVAALEPVIRDIASRDSNLVWVKRVNRDAAKPEDDLDRVVWYILSGQLAKHLFEENGVVKRKRRGKRKLRGKGDYETVGPNRLLYRRLLQILEVSGLHRCTGYGFLSTSRGKKEREALMAAIHQGYRKRQAL